MGHSHDKFCPLCEKPLSIWNTSGYKCNGGSLCSRCAMPLVAKNIKLKNHSLEELRALANVRTRDEEEAHKAEVESFTSTKRIGDYILFDDANKKFAIPQTSFFSGKIIALQIYDYASIVEFELLEDGNSIEKGGIGRAIVGGVLFGGVGAIVGGNTGHKHRSTCSKLQVKITLDNISNPVIYLDFIGAETRKDRTTYKSAYLLAQETISVLSIITKALEQTEEKNTQAISCADEIIKFKQLLDSGVITQEEFDAKKKQLLGL